nr:MAG TPA: hypothetical protein [Caudoviricetes sp.]
MRIKQSAYFFEKCVRMLANKLSFGKWIFKI